MVVIIHEGRGLASCRFFVTPKSLKHISPYTGAVTPCEGEDVWLVPQLSAGR